MPQVIIVKGLPRHWCERGQAVPPHRADASQSLLSPSRVPSTLSIWLPSVLKWNGFNATSEGFPNLPSILLASGEDDGVIDRGTWATSSMKFPPEAAYLGTNGEAVRALDNALLTRLRASGPRSS
mmetsp:Transcript_106898/g.334413  ORF Transcript_106898/g.334413 Transcript_106898/m.334413 type:complete len:125 (+) Transcript_106898:149-523(+)